MTRERFRFMDIITGEPVYYYRDRYNRRWLANHSWSLFRVRPPTNKEPPHRCPS